MDGWTDGEATVGLPPWDAGGRASREPTSCILRRGAPGAFHGWRVWGLPPAPGLPHPRRPRPKTPRSHPWALTGPPSSLRAAHEGRPAGCWRQHPWEHIPRTGIWESDFCRAKREGRRTLNTSSAARAIAQGWRLPGGGKANCKAAAEKKKHTAVFSSVHLRSKPTPSVLISASPGRGKGTS